VKLLVVIVQDQDSAKLAEQLVANGYRSTKLASTGGFLKVGSTTMLVGVEDEQVDGVIEVVKSVCHTREKLVVPLTHAEALGGFAVPPVTVQVGGAVIFVLNVDQFYQTAKS
jgi:uncharacterized protein YaaQ